MEFSSGMVAGVKISVIYYLVDLIKPPLFFQHIHLFHYHHSLCHIPHPTLTLSNAT